MHLAPGISLTYACLPSYSYFNSIYKDTNFNKSPTHHSAIHLDLLFILLDQEKAKRQAGIKLCMQTIYGISP